jgi:hypothetical protein
MLAFTDGFVPFTERAVTSMFRRELDTLRSGAAVLFEGVHDISLSAN